MTALEAVRAELMLDSTLTALVSTRVYPQVMPEGDALPAVVLTVISDVPAVSMDGTHETRLRESRVQVDSYSKTHLQARAVAEAVAGVLGNLQRHDLSTVADNIGTDSYDDAAQVYRCTADYSVFR